MLEIKNLYHRYNNGRQVLQNINLFIPAGQIVGLVGPSGCGKSTLLRAMLGLGATQGTVTVDGKIIDHPNRDVGIVYQQYLLWDIYNAAENVAYGLKADQTSLFWPINKSRFFRFFKHRKLFKEHYKQACDLLNTLGLGHAVDQYPSSLSGGMKQRVAIAQSLIMKPKVLLLDEPFGAQDEARRDTCQSLIISLRKENREAIKQNKQPPHTVVIVTHELQEAIYICDRVLGLSQNHVGGHDGATFVYDKACPDFEDNDLNLILKQKEQLRNVVFSEELVYPDENVTYWKDMELANVK